jgi:alpha-D-xyloside xylohydrolase
MKIQAYYIESDCVVVDTSAGRLKVQAIGERVMRVVFTGRPDFCSDQSLIIVNGVKRSAPIVEDSAEHLVLSTSRLRLLIEKQFGAFTWTDNVGQLLFREPHDRADTKVLDEIDVLHSVFSINTVITTELGADGEKSVAGEIKQVVDRQAYSTKLRLEFSEGEALYGLGQHDEGVFNYRGHYEDLYQQNMKIVAPVLVSTRGYAIMWDSQSLASFHDDQAGSYFWTEVDDEMDFYVIAGPELDDIVHQIRTLTGKAPMLPRWALGYIQSKDRYENADELLEIVREYRRRGIPLDCIVQDWKHWPEGLWGQKSLDPDRYPDPTRLTEELHDLGAKMMVSIWPNMQNEGPNQAEFRAQGELLGDGSTYNAFNPDARTRYWEQVNEGYFRHGVDAFWADCTEPFEGDWKGIVKPEPWQRLLINAGELKKYLDPEHINAYSLLHCGGLYEGQRATGSDKRVFLLTRSGFVGQQRYSAVTWSGDTSATWLALRRQISAGLNLCVTGTPYWTFDIGAYFVTPGPLWFWDGDFEAGSADLGYRELYVRWLQMGTFLPVFRSHGRDTPREPWRFGDVGDASYETICAFIRLRYRLLPYLYSLSGWTTQRDYTPMRSLVFDFRHDPRVYDVDDQFMLGPSLLVCPITEPMYFGPDSEPIQGSITPRSVYLPAGCDWYDFWSNERFEGGQSILVTGSLETIPVFVRAGSVLPIGPDVQHTGEDAFGPLEMRIYPGADATFDLYEDAGDGYGYEKGEFTTTTLHWSESESKLTIHARAGSFPGMPATREVRAVVIGGCGISATRIQVCEPWIAEMSFFIPSPRTP